MAEPADRHGTQSYSSPGDGDELCAGGTPIRNADSGGEFTLLFHMSIGTTYSLLNPAVKEKIFCRPCIH